MKARPIAGSIVAVVAALVARSADSEPADLLDLSLEELSDLQVTSASRIAENLRETPAAVFVLTADEIRRSGVTSIPEALRLVPGVEVARRSAHAWSISIRGFNSDLSNKLLVLIDGRSVYSPLYAGVFWDVQDTLLEDVDRIEVVSGPGGTLWGANAVNGVINIITRPAGDTSGGYGEIAAGDEEELIAGFRYGGTVAGRIAARAYVKHIERDSTLGPNGEDSVDSMDMTRTGLRLDWDAGEADRFVVTAEAYSGRTDGVFNDDFTIGTLPAGTFRDAVDIGGASLLARWERVAGEASDVRLQLYWDRTLRDIPSTYDETRDTWDVDFQQRMPLGSRHDLLWGLNARRSADHIRNSQFASFLPASRSIDKFGAFVQDRIALAPGRLFVTLGTKLSHNEYTGLEYQPNVRLSWVADRRQTLWAAVSRAVRIPSRLDDDLVLTVPLSAPGIPIPFYVVVHGRDDIESEELLAYEAGYRYRHADTLSFDLAVFRNEYDRLRTNEADTPIIVLEPPLPHVIVPSHLDSLMEGDSMGATAAVTWQPASWWRMRLQYAYLDIDLSTKPSSLDVNATDLAGNSPRHQAGVHAYLDLNESLSLYTGLRYVGELPNQGIDAYVAADASLAWRLHPRAELSLTLRNLNDDTHPEFMAGAGNLVERSACLKLHWSF